MLLIPMTVATVMMKVKQVPAATGIRVNPIPATLAVLTMEIPTTAKAQVEVLTVEALMTAHITTI